MYRVSVKSNLPQVRAKFGGMSGRLAEELRQELDKQNRLTIQHVARTRLSFPRASKPGLEGLRVITGNLRRGAVAGLVNAYVHTPTTIVGGIENRVHYAKIHEFGFSGEVKVSSHTRRVESRSVTKKRKLIAQGIALVRAHTRLVDIPARAPVQKGFNERLPEYRKNFAAVVLRTFRTG